MQKQEDFDRARLESRMDSLLEGLDQGVMEDQLINYFPFSLKNRKPDGL